ncbi:MAG: N-formylglutamate deformylase [Rhodospirillaceae bacterium]|nr:N-formylglutamate deformylase [Rhodospirillaceae bacterium]
MSDWLTVRRGREPLIVCFPHAGLEIPKEIERRLASPWLARKDTDWWVHRLYNFAFELGATIIQTSLSRVVIDLNRDPSGAPLYPGQAGTDLCPLTCFDGEDLYLPHAAPCADEIATRRVHYFNPYHAAVSDEIARLRRLHPRVVMYDAHAIRSRVPRLFSGALPHLNIGSNNGTTCDPALTAAIESVCQTSAFDSVTNGRFKGGWATRHYGKPSCGVHAVQMEIAFRAYLDEPNVPTPENWPVPYAASRAEKLRTTLSKVLMACLAFAAQETTESAHA